MLKKIIPYLILTASVLGGCSNSSIYQSTNGQGIELSVSKLYPSRTGESYAIWFEVPISFSHGKGNRIEHANTTKKFAASFQIAGDGSIINLDTTDLLKRLGVPLALVVRAIISIEKTGRIDTAPSAVFLGGDISGNAATGTASLSTEHADALNGIFFDLLGAVTLAYPSGKPATDLELYFMNATSPTHVSPGTDGLPSLPSGWKYGLWAIDSSTKSLPPFNIFYGLFLRPDSVDSQPTDNHYHYPGGRYPADSTQPVYDLRSSGKVSAIISLEPVSGGTRPSVPFGAIILQATIPASTQDFSPIELTNRAGSFPTASIIIHR